MWKQCFNPSSATFAQYACMGCVYSAGSEKPLPVYGGHCTPCKVEREWDLKMIGSLCLSRDWQEVQGMLGPSIATMATNEAWLEFIESPAGLEGKSLLPEFLMLKPAVTGGVFSSASLGGTVTDSQKATLVGKMKPGFDASVNALKLLCVSLNLTVPPPEGDDASTTPPESERKAWEALNLIIKQVRRFAHTSQGNLAHPALDANVCVCVLLLQDLLQSCARGGRRRVVTTPLPFCRRE